MEIISVNKNVNLDGETIYEVTAKPIHYYDSYLINEVEYVSNGQTKKASFGAKIELSFYKDISKYEDWQNISTDLFENYRLIADIDFSGKTNVKTNVNINRLEGTDGGHTLSNITSLTYVTLIFSLRSLINKHHSQLCLLLHVLFQFFHLSFPLFWHQLKY